MSLRMVIAKIQDDRLKMYDISKRTPWVRVLEISINSNTNVLFITACSTLYLQKKFLLVRPSWNLFEVNCTWIKPSIFEWNICYMKSEDLCISGYFILPCCRWNNVISLTCNDVVASSPDERMNRIQRMNSTLKDGIISFKNFVHCERIYCMKKARKFNNNSKIILSCFCFLIFQI